MVSEEWDEGFRNIKQSIMHRVISDHSPLMLQCGNWEPVKSYFKFENWWLLTEGFKDRIKNWWDSFSCVGRSDYVLALKLKALKEKLKEWSKSIQGNLDMQKLNILGQLAELEEIQELRILNDEEIHKKATLLLEFEETARKEEIA